MLTRASCSSWFLIFLVNHHVVVLGSPGLTFSQLLLVGCSKLGVQGALSPSVLGVRMQAALLIVLMLAFRTFVGGTSELVTLALVGRLVVGTTVVTITIATIATA